LNGVCLGRKITLAFPQAFILGKFVPSWWQLKTLIYLFLKNWMAFEDLHRPLFREHGSIYFANGNKPSKEFNYAFCEVCFPWLQVVFARL